MRRSRACVDEVLNFSLGLVIGYNGFLDNAAEDIIFEAIPFAGSSQIAVLPHHDPVELVIYKILRLFPRNLFLNDALLLVIPVPENQVVTG